MAVPGSLTRAPRVDPRDVAVDAVMALVMIATVAGRFDAGARLPQLLGFGAAAVAYACGAARAYVLDGARSPQLATRARHAVLCAAMTYMAAMLGPQPGASVHADGMAMGMTSGAGNGTLGYLALALLVAAAGAVAVHDGLRLVRAVPSGQARVAGCCRLAMSAAMLGLLVAA